MKTKLVLRKYVFLALAALTLSVSTAAESAELEGLIEPYLVVNVGSSVPGILDMVKVDRGAMVQKGQVLAKLQDKVERANMALAKARARMKSTIAARRARLDYAQRRQQRMESLFKKKRFRLKKWMNSEPIPFWLKWSWRMPLKTLDWLSSNTSDRLRWSSA